MSIVGPFPEKTPLNAKITGKIDKESYRVENIIYESQPGFFVTSSLFIPAGLHGKAPVVIYCSGHTEDGYRNPVYQQAILNLVKKGFIVLIPDLIGHGEMGPGEFKGDSFIGGYSYNVWFLSMLIGRSIVGIQAGDVNRLTGVLKKRNDIKEIYGFAKRSMTPILLHAAAFEPDIKRVALIEPYLSYGSIVIERFYNPGLIQSTVPGALTAYDLPDLAASLVPRKLLVVNPIDARDNYYNPAEIANEMAGIETVYHYKNSPAPKVIWKGKSSKKPDDLYSVWIK